MGVSERGCVGVVTPTHPYSHTPTHESTAIYTSMARGVILPSHGRIYLGPAGGLVDQPAVGLGGGGVFLPPIRPAGAPCPPRRAPGGIGNAHRWPGARDQESALDGAAQPPVAPGRSGPAQPVLLTHHQPS